MSKKDMPSHSVNDRQNRSVLAVVLMLMVFSVSSAGYGLSSQVSPARPSSQPAKPAIQQQPASADTSTTIQLPFSKPVAISIPSIKVESDLIEVGKNADGTIEVPAGKDFDKAAWYKHGATPGQFGSAVIEGHVDSAENGPSIFFSLGSVQAGQSVFVDRADGIRAEFIIDSVEEYTKDKFPTELVYGLKNYAGLALITCGGDFNAESGEYDSNIVVLGHLKGSTQ